MSEKSEWEKKKIAEFQKEIEEKNKKLNKDLAVNITVDPTPLNEAVKHEKEAEERAQELQEKLDLIVDAQSEKLLNDMGITDPEKRFELKANPDMLIGYKKAFEDQQKQKPHEGGHGSAPLNQQQITGGMPQKQGYNSTEELIEDLQSRSRQGDKNAEQVLGQLLVKSLKGVKENRQGFGQFKPCEGSETEIQRLNRIWREKQLRNRGD
jgi:hypothetical protein